MSGRDKDLHHVLMYFPIVLGDNKSMEIGSMTGKIEFLHIRLELF